MSNFASEHSTWLKEYCKRVKKAKAQSNGNKKIIPIIIFLMAGGLDAYLIFAKDGLNDPQLQGHHRRRSGPVSRSSVLQRRHH